MHTPKTPPDLTIGPLYLWIHGYEYVQADNFHDANWLRASALVSTRGARVEIFGSVLMTSDLESWLCEIRTLSESLSGAAILTPLEPDLRVTLRAATLGRVEGEVEISPEPLTQAHRFSFSLDQSYLPRLVADLRAVLAVWPVRQ